MEFLLFFLNIVRLPLLTLFTTYSLNVSPSLICLNNDEWNLIIPIPKTGDKSRISNYRLISLLCNLSKVLEKIVFDKIYKFISETSISIHQFGFMSNRSTLKQLILYTEFLYSSLDHHQQVDSIYLDIRKAFDSVPHNKLLVKLYAYSQTTRQYFTTIGSRSPFQLELRKQSFLQCY